MIRAALIFAFLGSVAVVSAQTPAPAFEVASVKPNTAVNAGGSISGPTPGRHTITNVPLRFIILDAYQLRDHQLIDAPDWTFSSAYDISAKLPEGSSPTPEEIRVMMQTLLADRFGLKIRRERRELPSYDLVLARTDKVLGLQLTRSDIDCEKWLADKKPQIGAGGPSPVMPTGLRPACMMLATRTYISGGTRTIAQLAVTLQSMARRPVIDRTGLTGTFNIDLRWDGAETGAKPETVSADAASIFTAVQEQLGLKLEPSRSPFDVVVIESVERPRPD
jgi:uncharacterized protein (TIGR03435 family)